MSETVDFDIMIAGAGPTGLAFALLMADQGYSIGIIEKQDRDALCSPAYDGREIALTQQSWRSLQKIGAVAHILDGHVSLLKKAHVLNGRSNYALTFSADDVHESYMGYMVSNHHIRRALYEETLKHKSITILTNREIVEARTGKDGVWVRLHPEGEVRSRLLVAADSRLSKVRDMIGISSKRENFHRTCIVCRIRHEKDLCQTAYEIFGLRYTIAILPLKNGEASLVLTLPSHSAAPMIEMDARAFIKNITQDIAPHCGEAALVSERFSYPLIGVHADRFIAERFALLGDAAVGMHPVTAHGFNFGLSGANILSSEINNGRSKGMDFWDERILAAYERKHRRKTLPLYNGTNALVKLYVRTGPLSRAARQALLHAGNILTPAKRMIIQSLTGKAA